MRNKKSRPLAGRLLLPVFLLLVVLLAAYAVAKFVLYRPESPPPVAETRPEPKPRREITLYFGAPEGGYLLPEGRAIEECTNDRECVAAVVQALIEGPTGVLEPILPRRLGVREVAVADGTAVVDFGPELIGGHPGGSMSELLTVYGLVDSLAVNFPHIRQLRILVEGQGVDTLGGHVGLREAVPADFGYARPPAKVRSPEEAPADGGETAGRGEGRET